jgi:hypothetical protein
VNNGGEMVEHTLRMIDRNVAFTAALPQFGDQPCVFHRHNSLRGEVLQQRDLLVGERPDLPPPIGSSITKLDQFVTCAETAAGREREW